MLISFSALGLQVFEVVGCPLYARPMYLLAQFVFKVFLLMVYTKQLVYVGLSAYENFSLPQILGKAFFFVLFRAFAETS